MLAHARALLTSTPEGATDYIDADLRDPDRILAAAAETLDFSQPVALMLMGILGHVPDDDEARSIVRRLLDAPALRQLPLRQRRHARLDPVFEAGPATLQRERRRPVHPAHRRRDRRFFDGLELLDPGVVSVPLWRPDSTGPAPVVIADTAGLPAAVTSRCDAVI